MTAPNHSDSQEGNLNKVLRIINRLARKSAEGDYIYRGEPDHYDKVSSGLYRKLTEQFQVQGIIDVSEIPIEDIQAWILHESEKFTASNSEIEQSEILILSQLQHYGGETNLIDFTTDYLTALFFACDGEIDKDGRVIFLSKSGDMSKHIARSSHPANRVMAQKSIFVRPPKGYIEPDDTIPIPHKLKQPILSYLRICHGISTESIYNDFHGFIRVQALHQQAYVKLYAGMIYRNNKNYERAIAHCTEALRINPQMAVAYNELGNIYAEIGEYDCAIRNYSKAINLDPTYAGAYNNRGNIYADTGEYGTALLNYGKAIDLDPNYAAAYNNRGSVYADTGEYDLAIQDYSKAIDLDPNYAAAYHNLGNVYAATENYDLAIQNYSKAIDLDPDDPDFYFKRGTAWLCLSEWENAKSDLTDAISKGADIKSDFNEEYGSVAEFEQHYDVELPEDIKAMLA